MPTDPYRLRVKQVMSTDVVSVFGKDSVHEALSLMVENHVSALPVVDGRDQCVGIISVTDLVTLVRDLDDDLSNLADLPEVSSNWLVGELTARGMDNQQVVEVMTTSVAGIGEEATLPEAAVEMLRHRVHRLPVLGENNRLLGIVSTTDVMRAFVEGAGFPQKAAVKQGTG